MVYPTTEEVREWFKLQESGEAPKFFDLYVRDDVVWTVEVRQLRFAIADFEGTHPIAGTFHGKKDFMAGTIGKLRMAMKPGIWNTKVTNVFAGGNQACIEMIVSSEVRPPPFQS